MGASAVVFTAFALELPQFREENGNDPRSLEVIATFLCFVHAS